MVILISTRTIVRDRNQGRNMVFRITDTDVGMSGEQLEATRDKADTRKYASQRIGRYAIRNVRERLTLIYCKDYELKIEQNQH
ncbi:MAG: hypothetical protein K2K90_03615 [Lachnospiraceae bacterium]|nr:hypothetical protein [Lachnospiraceae bacterium]